MAPSNKPVTLRDLNHHPDASNNNNTANNNNNGGMPSTHDSSDILTKATSQRDPGLHEMYHIPSLPDAGQAQQLLARVVQEFRPIAVRRGFVVLSVSELCCCNDGLDFRDSGKHRKLQKVGNNIWGYNRTMGRNGQKVHTIHVRLRHPQNHARFLPYEDVAGTLAHELSHCVVGPHNDKFFKVMDSILEEHASLMASNMTTGGAFNGNNDSNVPPGFVPFAGQGRALGGETTKPPLLGRGYTLGGDASFTQWMTPREAAVAAALVRQRQEQLRLRGNHCCRPCLVKDDDDDEQVQIIDVVAPAGRKRAPKPDSDVENEKPTKRNQVIDLTEDDDDAKPAATSKWACQMCTFLNEPTRVDLCEICGTAKFNK